MPMPSKVASVSFVTAGATLAAGQKFITAAGQVASNPQFNRGGMYLAVWSLVCTAAANGSGLPMFTWYDQGLGLPLTATANLLPVSADFANNCLACSAIGAKTRGVFPVYCGSGASGVSAYIGYGISGAGNAMKFDCHLYHVDSWGV